VWCLDHGSGTGVQILNNQIHNIVTRRKKWECLRLVCLRHVTDSHHTVGVSGNEVYNLKTGTAINDHKWKRNSFSGHHNIVHDNDNIGIDAIGYEGTGPSATT